MAILINKLNREVKVIIPNMREFSTFYSDKEGVLPMFFKKDWKPIKEKHWKPSEKQMKALESCFCEFGEGYPDEEGLRSLYNDLKKLIKDKK